MQNLLILVLLVAIATIAFAQIPCDEAYGTHCPEAGGFEVGECLKKVDQSALSKECLDYITLHDTCRDDLNQHCAGKEYTGDALGLHNPVLAFLILN